MDLLRFIFCSEDYKRTDLRKPALIALVTSKYEDYLKRNITTVAPQPENDIEQRGRAVESKKPAELSPARSSSLSSDDDADEKEVIVQLRA